MNDLDIPILKKSYNLYMLFHEYRKLVPKQDRFSIYERSEKVLLDIIECFFHAGATKNPSKVALLEKASMKLNMFRFLTRLMKDTRSIDTKKYISIQEIVDEIGRMLGGWTRSIGK